MKIQCVLFVLAQALTASAALGGGALGGGGGGGVAPPQAEQTPSLTTASTASTEPDWTVKQQEYTKTMSFITTMKSHSTELKLTDTESSHSKTKTK